MSVLAILKIIYENKINGITPYSPKNSRKKLCAALMSVVEIESNADVRPPMPAPKPFEVCDNLKYIAINQKARVILK